MVSNRKAQHEALFAQVLLVSPYLHGHNVERYQSGSQVVDEFYPDWGLPDATAYATAIAPFVFMGVDFTAPFDIASFPLPITNARIHRLRHYLQECKKLARNQQLQLPRHLLQLYAHVNNWVRRAARRRSHDFRELLALPQHAHMTPEQVARSMNIGALRSAVPTNSRSMLFFLYDAPLETYQPLKLSYHDTMATLAESGWQLSTSLISAANAYRMRPMTRVQVFDPLLHIAHRAELEDNLAPLNLPVVAPALPPATGTAPAPTSLLPPAPAAEADNSEHDAPEETISISDPMDISPVLEPLVHPDPPALEALPPVDSFMELQPSTATEPASITETATDGDGTAAAGTAPAPLAATGTGGDATAAAGTKEWVPPSYGVPDAVTGTYPAHVADEAIDRLKKLPVELIAKVLYLGCHSQAEFLRLKAAFSVSSGAMPLSWQLGIGPVFFPPAWLGGGPQSHKVLPRSGDARMNAAEVVQRIRQLVVFPHTKIPVQTALKLWPWPASNSTKNWAKATQASIDVLGANELENKKQLTWQFSFEGKPLKDRSVARFLEAAHDILERFQDFRTLRSLDLRLGVWTLYHSGVDPDLERDMDWVYNVIQRNRDLEKLSFVADIRRWHADELHVALSISFHRLLGLDPPITMEDSPIGPIPSQPIPPERSQLNFVSFVAPDALMLISPPDIWPRLGFVTTFVLVCDRLSSSVGSLQLVYQVLQRFHSTLEHLNVSVICDDESVLHKDPCAGPMGPDSDDEDADGLEDYFGDRGKGKAKSQPMDPAEGCGDDITAAKLVDFHFEGQTFPSSILNRIHMPSVKTFVFRVAKGFIGTAGRLSTPLRELKRGAMGPFKGKNDALLAYQFVTGGELPDPVLSGAFILFGTHGQPFELTREELLTHQTEPSRYETRAHGGNGNWHGKGKGKKGAWGGGWGGGSYQGTSSSSSSNYYHGGASAGPPSSSSSTRFGHAPPPFG